MDYITLRPGLPPSSRLGFGCGSVMGRVGRAESLRAIAAALDAGISHFDVARLYGYGEAEALLGEALRGRRDRVVIASKFGLDPPRAASALRGLKPLAQKLVGSVPGLRPLLRSAIGTKARAPDRFSVAAARQALRQSLAALGTDYLDILFLHDCGPDDLGDELAGFLHDEAAAGTIRAFGVATGIDTVERIHARRGDAIVYQFGNSLCVPNALRLPAGEPRFIAHSPFHGAEQLRQLLKSRPDALKIDGRIPARTELHRLMLAYALASEGVAVVLCSMLDPAHLAANLAAVESPAYRADAIRAYAARLAAPAA